VQCKTISILMSRPTNNDVPLPTQSPLSCRASLFCAKKVAYLTFVMRVAIARVAINVTNGAALQLHHFLGFRGWRVRPRLSRLHETAAASCCCMGQARKPMRSALPGHVPLGLSPHHRACQRRQAPMCKAVQGWRMCTSGTEDVRSTCQYGYGALHDGSC
jgi:hypothetical protein